MGSQEDTQAGFCTVFDSPGISAGSHEMQGSKQILVVPSKSGLGKIQTHKSFILGGDASERALLMVGYPELSPALCRALLKQGQDLGL